MIIKLDYNPKLVINQSGVYFTKNINRIDNKIIRSMDQFYSLGANFVDKYLLSTAHTKTFICQDHLYRKWKKENVFSSEFFEDLINHEVFQFKSAFIVCEFLSIKLSQKFQLKLIELAKANSNVIIIFGCDLLDEETINVEASKESYILRGKKVTKEDIYKAAGLFVLENRNLNFSFNIEKDNLFGRSKIIDILNELNLSVLIMHLEDNHKNYGMSGVNDFKEEYSKNPNRCPVPLQFLDPPIARLCKIIGSMGVQLVYSCVEDNVRYNCTQLAFREYVLVDEFLILLNSFESDLIFFERKYERSSWLGNSVLIKQKRNKFIVDNEYFWELQRLCDFLLNEKINSNKF